MKHCKANFTKYVHTIRDIDKRLPEAVFIQTDYDIASTLVSIGLLPEDCEENFLESEDWQECEYNGGLFVLLDSSGADYLAVWGYRGSVPDLSKTVDLLWYAHKLLV